MTPLDSEIESHMTPLDARTLFRRMGDTNPAHSPACPLTTATAPAADYRGRLLLNMLSSIEFIITNGRFPSPSPNHRHWNAIHTLKKDRSLDDPDALTFHRDELKKAQDALDKLRETKK